jgi:uncharacterized protein HemX
MAAIGNNWYLKQKLKIQELENTVDKLRIHNRILKAKLKKYEDNNIGTSRNWKDNNTIKLG